MQFPRLPPIGSEQPPETIYNIKIIVGKTNGFILCADSGMSLITYLCLYKSRQAALGSRLPGKNAVLSDLTVFWTPKKADLATPKWAPTLRCHPVPEREFSLFSIDARQCSFSLLSHLLVGFGGHKIPVMGMLCNDPF